MKKTLLALAVLSATAATLPAAAQDAGQINVICSVQAEWCNLMQTVYSRTTGVKVNMSLKGSGEALAQLIAEKANPKTDLWFGGTGDPHLQAAEQDLTLEYKSASLPQLHAWAQQQAAQSKFRTVGIYSGPLGFGYNPELLAKKKLPVPKTWNDLLKPEYRGEIQVANPASSGTGYFDVIAWLTLFGDQNGKGGGWKYMDGLHENIAQYTHSGSKPCNMAASGEFVLGISFEYRGNANKAKGAPIDLVFPKEGLGWDLESFAIHKGTKKLDAAKKLANWASSKDAMRLYGKNFAITAHPGVAEPLPNVPKDYESRLVKLDFSYAAEQRERILNEWNSRYNGKSEKR